MYIYNPLQNVWRFPLIKSRMDKSSLHKMCVHIHYKIAVEAMGFVSNQ